MEDKSMAWLIETTEKTGVSTYGWRRKAQNRDSATTRWEGEKYQEFNDLCHLARQWDFRWQNDGTVVPPGLGTASRFVKCAEGRNFSEFLSYIIADIARVVTRKGCRIPRNLNDQQATWSLNGGVLRVYYLRPTALEILGGPSGFMRVCFLLIDPGQHQGEGKHFYQWGMWNKDQALLPVDKPVKDWRITHMKQVDHKVFIVKNDDGNQAAIKFELATKNERYECTNFLAENLFEDGMMSRLTDEEDITTLRNASVKSASKYVPSDPTEPAALNDAYPEFIRLLGLKTDPKITILCKNEFKTVLKNLRDQLAVANIGNVEEKRKKLLQIFSSLYTETTFIFLGKIAVFDILVNNNDRIFIHGDYRPEANLKNFDFSLGYQPITIDNYDPNGHIKFAAPIRTRWKNHRAINTPARIQIFAKALLEDLSAKTNAAAYLGDRSIRTFELAFIKGIGVGKKNIVELLNPHGRTLKDKFGETGAEFFRRAELLRDE